MGNGPLTNRGCEAIVLGTKAIIEREFGPAEFLLASFADDSQACLPGNVHPVELPWHRPRWSSPWWRYQLRRLCGRPEDMTGVLKPLKDQLNGFTAAFSIGGDGYTIDAGRHILDRLVLLDNCAKSQGVPVIVWGASVGPFSSDPGCERFVARHFADMDLVVVREPISLRYLESLGVTENVRLAPDPGFALDPAPCALPDAACRLLEKPCIGVNFSPMIARHATGGKADRWISLAGQILDTLATDLGLSLLLIPHVTSRERDLPMDDDLFLRSALGAVHTDRQARMAIVPRGLSSGNLKWVIGQTTAFIGSRAHSIVAALSSRVPCLSVAYSQKAWGISGWVFGHTDWVLSSEELTPERVAARAKMLLAEAESVRSHLDQVIPGMVANAYGIVREVRAALSHGRARS
jgi:polysaccharide pyruvyl transferase WcaK-like protein